MMQKARLLIVDDDANTLASLARAFRLAGHDSTVCESAERALELAQAGGYDLVFSDVVMPGKDGLQMLEELRSKNITTPVVMISGQADIAMAVHATRLGAVDFLEKPISTEKLLLTVEHVLQRKRLEDENRELRQKLGRHEIVWASQAMAAVMQQIERVAPTETRVCIQGETGTGKELAARAIHQRSPRREGPFVALNCAAVPAELVESELFGHEKGAFTGAAMRHSGKFEQARGGTLFLDEIGDMPGSMQGKLLRVLEEGEMERVGGEKSIQTDVRIVTATHRNLEELLRAGKFRQDLFHRIVVYPLQLPALRERREDIPVLVKHFAEQIARQNGWKPAIFTDEAVAALAQHDWPGNIRELRNAVERVLLFALDNPADRETVRKALPQLTQVHGPIYTDRAGSLASRVEAFERETVLQELKLQHHHITNTAKALGLERSHLYKKCQQLGIDLRTLKKTDE